MSQHQLFNQADVSVKGRELSVTRRFQAPRELVYEAWTDPRHLAHWWGPQGFTITTEAIDVRPGGVWSYIMHGPDGVDYINRIRYIETALPERLVYSHGDHETEELFHVTVTFAAKDGGTELTMRSMFRTEEELQETVEKYGAIEGAKSTLSRLAEELESRSAIDLILSRTLHAPRDLVFRAWTDPEHLMHWWGPVGMELGIARFELRPGGIFHYSMRSPDGHEMYGRFIFQEISPSSRLVYVSSFADAEGNVIRAPFNELFPLELLNILTFEEKDGNTTMTLHGSPIHATEEEMAFYRSMHPSMQQGFGGTFAQLENHLAEKV